MHTLGPIAILLLSRASDSGAVTGGGSFADPVLHTRIPAVVRSNVAHGGGSVIGRQQRRTSAFLRPNPSVVGGDGTAGAFLASLRGGGGESSDGYDSEGTDSDTGSDTDEEVDGDADSDGDTDTNNTNNAPVQLILQTTLLPSPTSPNSSTPTALTPSLLLDQRIELTASRTRTVSSLKQSVSRQFKSRPPISSITLRFDGEPLDDDDVTLAELLEDYEEEEGEDGAAGEVVVAVDMVPPVDPKFGTEMRERLDRMTNEEVLDAYVANLAAGQMNTMEMVEEMAGTDGRSSSSVDGEEEGEEEEEDYPDAVSASKTLSMRRRALVMKEEILQSVREGSADQRTKWEEKLGSTDTPQSIALRDQQRSGDDYWEEEGGVRRRRNRGGATMNVKKAMQRNLNVNWPDTIRNVLLFLFFGYFGGKSAFSRSVMLLGAPACVLIQARPVKLAIKQTFYAIGQPPAILLSLLPAPQQAIMSCDYAGCMRDLYGKEADLEEEEDGTDWSEEEEEEEEVVRGMEGVDESYDGSDEDEYLRDILESFEDEESDASDSSVWDSSDGEEYHT